MSSLLNQAQMMLAQIVAHADSKSLWRNGTKHPRSHKSLMKQGFCSELTIGDASKWFGFSFGRTRNREKLFVASEVIS
ncbi:MAG: hypothetical protein KME32_34100 [Mojavia pulchra JT2-VF2]|jgi:hypothetical protein|uniref:Uncharacterized protein n=1 Tax=Mojavia pulchra JT2-VF2 TaxID=287848 RepID=A0A951Q8F0_9NOST|nr:hypothetical protein [Mojavia pulchra JT2-VF2]